MHGGPLSLKSEAFSESRPLVAAAFRLPHDGDLKVAATSVIEIPRQELSAPSNKYGGIPPSLKL